MWCARHVAGRFGGRGESQADLEQVTFVGFVKAVDNYGTAFDTAFLTGAAPVISGEIERRFRDGAWDVHVSGQTQEVSAFRTERFRASSSAPSRRAV